MRTPDENAKFAKDAERRHFLGSFASLRPLRLCVLCELCVLSSSRPRLRSARRAFSVFLFTPTLRHEALAFVEPHLDADLAVGRVRFRKAVIDVGAQRL